MPLSKNCFILKCSTIIVLLAFSVTSCESTLSREFNLLMNARDYSKSEQLLLNKIESNPDHAEANYLLGFLYAEQQQFEKSVEYLDKSYESFTYREHITYIKERNFNLQYSKGVNLLKENEAGNAIKHFRNATVLKPEDQEAYLMLGIAQSIFGRTIDGIESFKSCLSLNPTLFKCSWNLSRLYYSTSDYQNSIAIASKYLEHDPDNVQVMWVLVNNYLDSKLYSEAEQAFQRIREYFMSDVSLIQSAAVQLTQTQTTVKFTEQGLSGYLKQMGFRFFELGEYKRAVIYLKESVNREPVDLALRRTLNLAAFYDEDYETLSQSGQKLLELVPNDKATLAQLIIAFEKTGDLDNLKISQSKMEGIQ